jgi:beta-glucanase (GH16 family)
LNRRGTLAAAVLILATVACAGFGLPAEAQSSRIDALGARPLSLPKAVGPPAGAPEFSATFTGTKLDTHVWDTCYPAQSQSGCTNYGNVGHEFEWYLPSQVQVGGGNLKLVATRIPVKGKAANGTSKEYYCRSGMVTSFPGFKFQYGFVQIVADVPHAAGLWPALWLAAANGQWPPEIDMLESWGVNHEVAAFFHPVGIHWVKGNIPLSLTQGWQTYSLRWTSSQLTFYVGNQVVLTTTSRVPQRRMYLLANIAEYVQPAAGNCTGTMLIKSVKVWK